MKAKPKSSRRRAAELLAAEQVGAAELGAEVDLQPGILVEFRHGLGDLVQLSIFLAHLHAEVRGVPIDVVCEAGRALSKTRFERCRFGFGDPRHDRTRYRQVLSLGWEDCAEDVDGWPSTKTLRCVKDTLRLPLRPEFWRYTCEVNELTRMRASRYLASVTGCDDGEDGRFPAVLIHNRGYSSRMNKDVPGEMVRKIIDHCHARQLAVVLLDLEAESPLVDQKTVFAPVRGHPVWQRPGSADPETMLALIDGAALMIGIDSGPLHLAGCSSTPSIGMWTHHHPIRFFDFADNVVHLVPPGHARLAPGPRSVKTFQERYRHVVYGDLPAAVCEQLDQLVTVGIRAEAPHSEALKGLCATDFEEDYYREHLLSGLDYLGHGEWQLQYGRWLARALGWKGRRVLDVGCACGSILRGLGEAGMVVQGVDVSRFMVGHGSQKWPDMARLMHVADAADLSIFPARSWHGIHTAQVAEHWKPERVPMILRELARVTAPGGLWFCASIRSNCSRGTAVRWPTKIRPTCASFHANGGSTSLPTRDGRTQPAITSKRCAPT